MKKIVIMGGGFAGSEIARKLENKFDVTLIDAKDYFEFTPGVLRTIVKPEHIRKIQVLHSRYLKKTEIVVGNVGEVNKKSVKIGNKKVSFDYLVVASGSKYNSPFKEAVINTARADHLKNSYKAVCKAKNILIVGGGLVGVELAGEILDSFKGKKIIMVHRENNLIERNNKKAINYAEEFLRKNKVNIILKDEVDKIKNKTVTTKNGQKIESDLIFLCTGIKPNFSFLVKHFSDNLNEKNQVIVNPYLQIYRNIFAAGDVSSTKEEKTAQNAERQAKVIAHNILALEKNKKLRAYEPRTGPLVISLGRYNGIFVYKNITFTGVIPGLLKSFIEFREMYKKGR